MEIELNVSYGLKHPRGEGLFKVIKGPPLPFPTSQCFLSLLPASLFFFHFLRTYLSIFPPTLTNFYFPFLSIFLFSDFGFLAHLLQFLLFRTL